MVLDADISYEEWELGRIWRGADGFQHFCQDTLTIVAKSTQEIPLVLTPWQRRIAKAHEVMREIGVMERFIVDKARQVYVSTEECAYGFYRDIISDTRRVRVVMCDEYDKTENLYRMNEVFAANVPFELKYKTNKSDLEMTFLDTGTILQTMTAQNWDTGRSGTVTHLHMSECAFYPHFKEISEGLLPSVPDLPGTCITWESTANGFDPGFHPKWVTAIERADDIVREWNREHPDNLAEDHWDLLLNKKHWDGSYFPVFFSWKGVSEYRRDPRLEGLTMESATKVERHMMELYGLDLWEMAFRRYVIREKFRGPAKYTDDHEANISFQQEFPITWQESFVSTGRSVFQPSVVSVQLGKTLEDEKKVFVTKTGGMRKLIQPVDLVWMKKKSKDVQQTDDDFSPKYNQKGEITNREDLRASAKINPGGIHLIYKTPYTLLSSVPSLWDYRYVVGVDIAEGLAQGDYSVITVFDRVSYEFVHLYRAHISSYELAEEVAKVALYYDNAWIMGEYNKDGGPVIARLHQMTNHIMPRPELGKGCDFVNPKAYWFYTTASEELGKKYAIGLLDEMIRSKPACNPFSRFWVEANTFVRDARGRMGADGKRTDPGVKNFDDVIMASAMALVGHAYLPNPTESRKPIAKTPYEARKQAQKEKHEQEQAGVSILDQMPAGMGVNVL